MSDVCVIFFLLSFSIARWLAPIFPSCPWMQLWNFFNSGQPSLRSRLSSASRQGWKGGWNTQWCQLRRLFEHIDSHALQADVEAAVRELDAERGDKGVPTFLYAWYKKDAAARAQANPEDKRRGGRPRGSKKQPPRPQP